MAGWVLYCRECTLPSGHHDWCLSRPQSGEDNRRAAVIDPGEGLPT